MSVRSFQQTHRVELSTESVVLNAHTDTAGLRHFRSRVRFNGASVDRQQIASDAGHCDFGLETDSIHLTLLVDLWSHLLHNTATAAFFLPQMWGIVNFRLVMTHSLHFTLLKTALHNNNSRRKSLTLHSINTFLLPLSSRS